MLWALITLAIQNEVKITKKKWTNMAKMFGNKFITCYSKEDVTPYLHVHIYHVGYFLEKYKNLELFANYIIKGHHKYNKGVICTTTSGFSRADGPHNIQYQQLTCSWREHQAAKLPSQKQPRAHETWVTKSLRTVGDVSVIFPSE